MWNEEAYYNTKSKKHLCASVRLFLVPEEVMSRKRDVVSVQGVLV